MKVGEAVWVMGDIIPAQIWGLRGRLRVLSHDDLRVGRVLRLWMPRRSQTSLNPFSPPLVHRIFDFFIGTVGSNLAGANLDTYILDAIESEDARRAGRRAQHTFLRKVSRALLLP